MADFRGLDDSEPLYHVTRGGLRVFAATAAMLGPRRVRHLIEYRVAQYVHIGFVDVDRLDATLESNAARGGRLLDTTPEDIHIFAMSEQGELLCCAVLAAVPDASDTTRMRSRGRPLFPLERVYGTGIFDRLRVLPDLACNRVRELGGFVKTQGLPPRSELSIRAPVEVGVAIFRILCGPMALGVQAVIGDLEETVAKLNLELFGARPVLVAGGVPTVPSTSFLAPRYEGRTVRPFAVLISDAAAAIPRLEAIEEALGRSRQSAVLALLDLRSRARARPATGRSLPVLATAGRAGADCPP